MNNTSKNMRVAVLVATLVASPWVEADTVVIMAPGSQAMTKEQIASIYLARSVDLKPLDLPEGTPARDAFYKKVTERDAAQIKSLWSRIIFTGKGVAPKETADASAMKKAVAADPKAIGYIDKSAVDATVTVVFEVN